MDGLKDKSITDFVLFLQRDGRAILYMSGGDK